MHVVITYTYIKHTEFAHGCSFRLLDPEDKSITILSKRQEASPIDTASHHRRRESYYFRGEVVLKGLVSSQVKLPQRVTSLHLICVNIFVHDPIGKGIFVLSNPCIFRSMYSIYYTK